MYPVHITLLHRETGNLMLRHSVPIKKFPFSTFVRILEALCVKWRNSIPRFASTLHQGDENIKYFITSSGNWTHNLSRLQLSLCPYATTGL